MNTRIVNGHLVWVDAEDFDLLSNSTWRIIEAPNGRKYVYTSVLGYLHRAIMQVSDSSLDVDHRDRNGLNCRKKNLRVCTRSQNMANAIKTESKTTSRFKGVSWFRPAKLWRAYIGTRKTRTWLGYFKNEIDAAKAYDTAALARYGEFARLNL